MPKRPTFKLEKQYSGIVAGMDEAGRGPLCGPVIAGCAILNQKKFPLKLNDSKKLSEQNRKSIFNEILDMESKGLIQYGVGEASHLEIDKINIREATKLAMKRAYEDLKQKYNLRPAVVLIDGNFVPDIKSETKSIVQGDAKSFSIACASIIAKVLRDEFMQKISLEFPQYNWHKNKGYGTQFHINAIREYGITKYHRKSFVNFQWDFFK